MHENHAALLEQTGTAGNIQADAPPGYTPAVIAGFSGWMLDAFDFFLLTFCLTAIARDFHKTDVQMALVITATMFCRPLGGLIFGTVADRFGRRIPLMFNIGLFALTEILTGLAPNYVTLLVIRGLFGVVMGGFWGVGMSLAMEGAPRGRRGVLSGLLQEGYAAGNLLAAASFFVLFGHLGWRPMFFLGSTPAVLLLLFVFFKVKESPVWLQSRSVRPSVGQQWKELLTHWKLFVYLVALLAGMAFCAHGTQDMYPTFLQRQWHFLPQRRAAVTALAIFGALIGGIMLGHFSDKLGRRRTILIALSAGILLIPLWAYAPNLVLLVAGAFLMQFVVQGAWGVIPAHLTELAPTSVRALLLGLAYQFGGLCAGLIVLVETAYAERTNYPTAMALTALSAFLLTAIMVFIGKERHGEEFRA